MGLDKTAQMDPVIRATAIYSSIATHQGKVCRALGRRDISIMDTKVLSPASSRSLAFTDGANIFINRQLMTASIAKIIAGDTSGSYSVKDAWVILNGVAKHELAHILFTHPMGMKNTYGFAAGAQGFWNMLEDMRIERLLVQRYAPIARYLRAMLLALIDPEADFLLGGHYDFNNGGNPAVSTLSYYFLVNQRPHIGTKVVADVRKLLVAYFPDAKKDEAMKVLRKAEQIARQFVAHVPSADPASVDTVIKLVRGYEAAFWKLEALINDRGTTSMAPQPSTEHKINQDSMTRSKFKPDDATEEAEDMDDFDPEEAAEDAEDDVDGDGDGEGAGGAGDDDEESDDADAGDAGEESDGDADGEADADGNADSEGDDGESLEGADGEESADGGSNGDGEGESDGESQEGDGDGAGGGKDGSLDLESDLPQTVDELRSKLTDDNYDEILDAFGDELIDEQFDSVLSTDGKDIEMLGKSNYGLYSSTDKMKARTDFNQYARISDDAERELQRVRNEVAPEWLRRKRAGRLDRRRYAKSQAAVIPDLNVFRKFDAGQEMEASLDVMLMVDVSSSMNHFAADVWLGAWAIRRALLRQGHSVSMIAYNSMSTLVESRDQNQDPDMIPYVGPSGNTNPIEGLVMCSGYFANSRANNGVLCVLTDGMWSNNAYGVFGDVSYSQAISQLKRMNVVTAAAVLGVGYQNQLESRLRGYGFEYTTVINAAQESYGKDWALFINQLVDGILAAYV